MKCHVWVQFWGQFWGEKSEKFLHISYKTRIRIESCLLLFQHKRAHPVILDGNEIGTTIGYKHNGDYFHYINGHTIEVSASKCMYKSLTYIDVIEPQETVWIQDMSVVGIAIHNFIDTSERVAPDNPRFHGQLEHVRDMLEQAVLRRILDTPPDGEATLDRKHIDRGYSQFCAAMY